MRIFLDIGHPAHVHYFKHFIKQMERNGHSFLITARDKDVSLELLNCYNINYKNRGRGGVGLVGKFFYMIRADLFLLIHAIHFKPDIFVSFSSPYAAQVSWLIRKPHIAFTDTEHATLGNLVCTPFSKVVCTPSCYTLDFGKKHFRFEGYMELSYLHPNYFTPAPIILDTLGIKAGEKYVIFRFVSWQASHDMGQSGLSSEMKRKMVFELSKYAKVFISSEGVLPDDLKHYQLNLPADKIHDILAYASLFIGEGATMVSECAMLGIPAIYVNSLELGYCTELEKKYGLVFNFRKPMGVLDKAIELFQQKNLSIIFQKRKNKMLSDKINVTEFFVWFIENYPFSVSIIKK